MMGKSCLGLCPDTASLLSQNDAINPEDFPEPVYKTFLMNLCPRPEIDEIFTSQ